MIGSPFQVVGTNLSGRGLAFDVAPVIGSADGFESKLAHADRGKRLAEIVEAAYREGRASAILSREDSYDLHCAVDVLRGLAVIVGPSPTGDRHRRVADILAQLLQDQEGGA